MALPPASIDVCVQRKSPIKTWQKETKEKRQVEGAVLNVQVHDSNGKTYKVVAWNDNCHLFEPEFTEGKWVRITKFEVTQDEIVLRSFTTVASIPDVTGGKRPADDAPEEEPAVKRQALSEPTFRTLGDVILNAKEGDSVNVAARVSSVGPLARFKTKKERTCEKRELTLTDATTQCMPLTVWNDKYIKESPSWENQVVGFMGVKLGSYRNQKQLSLQSDSTVTHAVPVDILLAIPDMPPAQHVCLDEAQARGGVHKLRCTLMNIAALEKAVQITYAACKCGKKLVKQQDANDPEKPWWCTKCDLFMAEPNQYRFMMECVMADDSTSLSMTAFDTTQQVLGISEPAAVMHAMERPKLADMLKQQLGKKYLCEIEFRKEDNKNRATLRGCEELKGGVLVGECNKLAQSLA